MISFSIIWLGIALLLVAIFLATIVIAWIADYMDSHLPSWVGTLFVSVIVITILAWILWAAQEGGT